LKREIWQKHIGEKYNAKCYIKWCNNIITPFNFEAGHNIPESKGGSTTIDNLYPICSTCNKSMGNRYSIHEFSEKFSPKKTQIGF
jgi:5-methylcytosine-specific restriction endonuclease McrA